MKIRFSNPCDKNIVMTRTIPEKGKSKKVNYYDNKETNEYEPIKFRLLKEPWQTDYENKLLKDFMYESTIR